MANNGQIDFLEIADKYKQILERRYNQQGTPLRGLQVTEACLTNVKLRPKDVEWFPAGCLQTEKNLARGAGEMRTESNMKDESSVQIQQGLCRGLLDYSMLVSYPSNADGDHQLKIDPCRDGQQQQKLNTPLTLDSGASPRQHGSGRIVGQKYDGMFKCKVYPKGKILTQGIQGGQMMNSSIDTQAAIEALHNQGEPCVHNFGIDGNGEYYFDMRCKVKFEIDVQMCHQ